MNMAILGTRDSGSCREVYPRVIVRTQSCKKGAIVVRWSLSGGLTVFIFTIKCCHSWHFHKWSADMSLYFTCMKLLIFIVMVVQPLRSIGLKRSVHASTRSSNLCSWGVVNKELIFNLLYKIRTNNSKYFLFLCYILMSLNLSQVPVPHNFIPLKCFSQLPINGM